MKRNLFRLSFELPCCVTNLPGPEGRILKAIAAHYPNAVPNGTAASEASYSATSSSYANPRSALKTKDLIGYPEKDHVAGLSGFEVALLAGFNEAQTIDAMYSYL